MPLTPLVAQPKYPIGATRRGVARKNKFDELWFKMWHLYNFNRDEFLSNYHKRSNLETAFSMMKAKFGGSVRAKTLTAQVNEVLCKVLYHNICVLIQSWYELGIAPIFEAECSENLRPVPNLAWEQDLWSKAPFRGRG